LFSPYFKILIKPYILIFGDKAGKGGVLGTISHSSRNTVVNTVKGIVRQL